MLSSAQDQELTHEPDDGPSLDELQDIAIARGLKFEGLDANELMRDLEDHATDRAHDSQNER